MNDSDGGGRCCSARKRLFQHRYFVSSPTRSMSLCDMTAFLYASALRVSEAMLQSEFRTKLGIKAQIKLFQARLQAKPQARLNLQAKLCAKPQAKFRIMLRVKPQAIAFQAVGHFLSNTKQIIRTIRAPYAAVSRNFLGPKGGDGRVSTRLL